jgi:hypothetical protein
MVLPSKTNLVSATCHTSQKLLAGKDKQNFTMYVQASDEIHCTDSPANPRGVAQKSLPFSKPKTSMPLPRAESSKLCLPAMIWNWIFLPSALRNLSRTVSSDTKIARLTGNSYVERNLSR